MHGRREDRAGSGLVDARHLLHRPAGQRDLPAGDRAATGLGHELVQRVLDAIGVMQRRRAERRIERAIAGPCPMYLEAGAGGGGDGLGRQHAVTLCEHRSARDQRLAKIARGIMPWIPRVWSTAWVTW